MSEEGRYDRLQGDEPEIETERERLKRELRKYKEDHWEDSVLEKDPSITYQGE